MSTEFFPRVREEFEHQLAERLPGTGGAIAVFRDGDLVLDQWGGDAAPGTPWERDSMAVTFSATKGVATATLLSVISQFGLDVDQPLGRYWPEFSESEKHTITVAEMLSHRAGLPYWGAYPAVVTAESPAASWLDAAEIRDSLAASPTVAGTRGKFAYHSLTLGWLVDGLIRSVTGGTVSEVLAATLTAPDGLEYYVGLPGQRSESVSTLLADPPLGVDPSDPDPDLSSRALLPGASGVDYLHNLDLLNSSAFHTVPQAAANGIGTARGLAGVYAALAALDLKSALTRFTQPALTITAPGPRRKQGLGFLVEMPTPWNATDTAFGHTGAGGGVGFYDPERRLAFAFVTNHMNFGVDERVDRLRAALAADLRPR